MNLFEHIHLDALNLIAPKRLPAMLQTEAAECGLACVAMIANYYGHRVDLATLRTRFLISRKGVTLANVSQIADALQLMSRPLRVEMDALKELAVPCILHWDFDHFVVLRALKKGRAIVHDPACGAREMSIAELAQHFTGVALELRPCRAFEQKRETRRIRLQDVVGRVAGLRSSFAQILVLALALEVFAVMAPFCMQWVVDGVVNSADRDLLTLIGAGFLILVIVQHAIGALRSWVVVHVSTLLNFQWLANVFTHLLKLPSAYFEKRHLGDVVSRFQAISVIQRTLTTSFVEAILDGIMSAVTLSMMLIYSPALSALAIVAMAIYAALRWAWYRPLRHATEEQIVHAAKQQSHFFESVKGIRSIQLFNRQTERRATWLNLLAEQVNADVRTQKLNVAFKTANGLVLGLGRVGVIWLAALLVLDRQFSVGMLFAFVAYKEQFAQRVSGLIDKCVDLKMMQLQGERLADIVLTPTEEEPVTQHAGEVAATLELRNVRFRYADGEPWVLDGVNLSVKAGEFVAIVGPSGCGKTTLLKIMIGLLQPREGEILIGGVSVKKLGATRFRQMIGTVLQDDQLFAGSLLQNICFFDPRPDFERIQRCAKLAAIHEEILPMPMGYNTLIGDMGTSISGGQQQRVLLARALYAEPEILFLDEATSHLDVAREREVNAAVQQLALTRIIIAHRPETIAMARRVVRLESGTIVADLPRAPERAAHAINA